MFNKGSQKKSASSGVSSTQAAGTASGVSSNAAGTAKAGVPSIISADLRIEGNLHSNGDVQVDGMVIGDIMSKTLTLGEGSHVTGSVSADTVRICGTVEGEVKSSSVILTKTARVIGDVMHDSLAIEAGAYIDGHCRRLEQPVQSKPESKPAANGAASPAEGGVPGSEQPAS